MDKKQSLSLAEALEQYADAVANRDGRHIEVDQDNQVYFKGVALGLFAERRWK